MWLAQSSFDSRDSLFSSSSIGNVVQSMFVCQHETCANWIQSNRSNNNSTVYSLCDYSMALDWRLIYWVAIKSHDDSSPRHCFLEMSRTFSVERLDDFATKAVRIIRKNEINIHFHSMTKHNFLYRNHLEIFFSIFSSSISIDLRKISGRHDTRFVCRHIDHNIIDDIESISGGNSTRTHLRTPTKGILDVHRTYTYRHLTDNLVRIHPFERHLKDISRQMIQKHDTNAFPNIQTQFLRRGHNKRGKRGESHPHTRTHWYTDTRTQSVDCTLCRTQWQRDSQGTKSKNCVVVYVNSCECHLPLIVSHFGNKWHTSECSGKFYWIIRDCHIHIVVGKAGQAKESADWAYINKCWQFYSPRDIENLVQSPQPPQPVVWGDTVHTHMLNYRLVSTHFLKQP